MVPNSTASAMVGASRTLSIGQWILVIVALVVGCTVSIFGQTPALDFPGNSIGRDKSEVIRYFGEPASDNVIIGAYSDMWYKAGGNKDNYKSSAMRFSLEKGRVISVSATFTFSSPINAMMFYRVTCKKWMDGGAWAYTPRGGTGGICSTFTDGNLFYRVWVSENQHEVTFMASRSTY